jgi:hypothetical protein
LQASLPTRGRGLHVILPSKGERPRLMPSNALLREELVGGPAAGIVLGPLPRNGSGQRGATMAELLKMAGRGVLTTSSRSSVTGESLDFTMPLVPQAPRCFPLVHSHLPWERYATALAICSPDSGCLHLLPTSGFADGSSPLGSDG